MNCPNCGKPVFSTQKTCRCGASLAAAGSSSPAYPSQGQPTPAGQGFHPLGGMPQNVGSPPPSPGGTQKPADMARLRIREYGMEREFMLSGGALTIGRDPAAANLLVGQPNAASPYGLLGVSRQHARLTCQNGVYSIEDLSSANGTFLRGRRLFPTQAVALQNGDVIRIGAGEGNSVSLVFNDDSAGVSAQSMTLDPAKLQAPQVSLGRDPSNGICLPSPMVSAVHALIRRNAGRHEVIDNHSTNGIFVNGRRVSRAWLNAGDELQIGPYKLSYGGGQSGLIHASRHIRLDGVRIFKQVWDKDKRQQKVLLDNVSLSILPGEFVALVGGSGAGKSTLMDALNGSRPAERGNILVNGQDLYAAFDANRTNMGYVPQNDILHLNLTVKNALWYTAMLRLPADFGKSAGQRVQEVVKMVELDGKESTRIDRLSGGQRKRVSIASELLSDPSLLFLDEPTSGLDPGLDKKMMDTLNLLADGGRTILLTTHATNNILDTCDQVAFMSHGHLTYYGPPRQAMNFFHANNDFATIYNMVEKPDQAVQKEQEYRQSPDCQAYVTGRQNSIPQPSGHSRLLHHSPVDILSSIRQFFVLTMRYLDLIFHDTFSMIVLLAAMPIIGILIDVIASPQSLIGKQPDVEWKEIFTEGVKIYNPGMDAQKMLFMISLSVILFGLFASAYEIIKEKTVYQRERMINLQIIPYVLSKITVLMVFGLVQVAVLMFIVGIWVHFPHEGVLYPFPVSLEIYITLVLAMLSSICIGLAISALVGSRDAVIYIILVVLIVQIVFSGALFDLKPAGQLISYLTPTRWTLQTMGSINDVYTLGQASRIKFNDKPEDGQPVALDMNIPYGEDHNQRVMYLFGGWFVLLLFAFVSTGATIFLLKKQDVR